MTFTKSDIKKCVDALKAYDVKPMGNITLPMRDDIALTVNGAVVIPGFGYMHPEAFRDIAGEAAYQELLKRTRIVSEYD